VTWQLPLTFPPTSGAAKGGAAATLGTLIAIVAGLLVVFSPCAVHMTAYFLPLVTGLGMRDILDRKDDVRFRAHVASLGLAFVSGFVVLYTLFGVSAGFAGQLLSDTTHLQPYLTPLRIVTGAVVLLMAMQTLGVFRMPFAMRLALPGKPHESSSRRGYMAAAIAGMSISVGCLTCVGGSLLATLLLYAGASSSPVVGGLTLFLFSVGMSMPFLLAALAFDRVVPRFTRAQAVLRHSTTVAGAVMIVVSLLILSGNESVFEQLVFRAL
jgi:cytochrome c-type biogenesis protein